VPGTAGGGAGTAWQEESEEKGGQEDGQKESQPEKDLQIRRFLSAAARTMPGSQNIRHAAHILEQGGVIAYPTEGVYGLGCLADDVDAVVRILTIKQRDPDMGLVVVASGLEQLGDWIRLPDGHADLGSSDERPVTWIVPATEQAPALVRGKHESVAVRLTTHPVARALCEATDSALVSTSANISGHPPARNRYILRREFGHLVDYIVPGDLGPAGAASEIRDLSSGKILRSA
jgi:L-threonylcarbamoyladenylate synthase